MTPAEQRARQLVAHPGVRALFGRLSPDEFFKVTGISRQTLDRWRLGDRCKGATVERIAERTGRDAAEVGRAILRIRLAGARA